MQGWKHRLLNASELVALLGLVFVIGGSGFWYVELAPTANSMQAALFELVMHVLFGGVILFLGIHIEQSELSSEERYAVIIWCYGGFTIMFVLSVWGHVSAIVGGAFTQSFVSDFIVFSSLGGAFGVIAGINWGRANRNKTLAEENEEQRETLALLTQLLSHDIRNDLAIIRGRVDLLADQVTEEGKSHIEIIQDQVDEITELLEDADALIKSLDTDREFEVINLSHTLRQEINSIKSNNPNITVETDIPQEIPVEADDLINQIFTNLFQNAVFHNDNEDLTISVKAEEDGDNVDIVIDDNGKGIPPEIQETCFELGKQGPESNGDGIGLYLVSRLADIYGGSAEVGDSPSGGARFRITLPTATSKK
ncbi:MAG: sensor histidine kinase [Halobacteriaceae archaeon]